MPKNDETAGLDFLDFLFTVAISFGLTPEILQISGMRGLLSEDWQTLGRSPSTDEFFSIGVFLLGFLNLTLSWFGYHASIKSRPLNYFSGYGMVRFILDVSLVLMYGVILLKYKSFNVVLSFLLLVWLIFVIWDVLKIREYWQPDSNSDRRDKYFKPRLDDARATDSTGRALLKVFRREWVSLFWFLALALVAILHFCCGLNRWIILVSAGLATVLYRINKNHPMWEKLLKIDNA